MPNLSRIHLSEGSSPVITSKRLNTWRKRMPYYGTAGVLIILTLAYFDGGAEPIHPITQAVAIPAVSAGSGQ